jgi:rhodanese-related sulfurtransferase/uncharacterized membrane protein
MLPHHAGQGRHPIPHYLQLEVTVKIHRTFLISLVISLFSLLLATVAAAQSGSTVVHAVLFYSPTCPHCQIVREQVLPPMYEKYGSQLDVLEVDITQISGQDLFIAAIHQYSLDGGVPTLIVGDNVMVGSVDIPEKFPGLIEKYLAEGGVDWPDIPGLAEMVGMPAAPTVIPSAPVSVSEKLKRDPLGNALAIAVLIGILAVVIGSLLAYRRWPTPNASQSANWLVPLLCLAGLGVAGYMSYVEAAQVSAVCGPVGDCNAVQQSEYARLFGVLPIGILGIGGYLAILVAWLLGRQKNLRLADYANLSLLGLSAFGILFSIYLTFLEPFVIGATCAWCLTSAVIMTALFWLSMAYGKPALSKLIAAAEKKPDKKKRRYRAVSKSASRRKRLVKTRQKSSWLWVGFILAAVGITGFLLWPKSPAVAEISADQAYQKYLQGAFFLDVRGIDEWSQGHIPNSTPISLEELPNRLSEIPQDQEIVVVCHTGVRSKTGVTILQKAGFQRVACLSGGLQSWVAAGYPLEASSP